MALVTAIRDGRAEWIEAGSNKAMELAGRLWASKQYEIVKVMVSERIIFYRQHRHLHPIRL